METLKNAEQNEQKSEFNEFIGKVKEANVTVYEELNASNDKAAKQEFLDNPNLIHPNNEYGNLNEDEVRSNLETLNEVSEQLKSSWLNDKEKRLINIAIDDNKRKNEFLAANIAYNTAATPEEKATAAEWHKEANANLYGKPDKDTFYSLLSEKINSIDNNNLSPENQEIYNRLIHNIGNLEQPEKAAFRPKPETIQRFSELIKDYYGNFLSHIPENQDSFSSKEAVDVINEILDTEFDGETGFSAIIDSKAANASYSNGVIKFPEDKTYSKERLSALILHELGTHAMRSFPYREQNIKPFATGLTSYETFEEGLAGCVEQALKGEYEDFGDEHYINIGLATFKDKNFREVYDIQKDLVYLTGGDEDSVIRNVQRCFRGTGELPNNKDLAYYTGNIQAWQYIENHIDDPALFDNLFLSGKIDLTDPRSEALSYEMRTSGSI